MNFLHKEIVAKVVQPIKEDIRAKHPYIAREVVISDIISNPLYFYDEDDILDEAFIIQNHILERLK